MVFLPGRPGEVHFRPDSGDLEAGILRLRRGYRAHGLTVNVIAGVPSFRQRWYSMRLVTVRMACIHVPNVMPQSGCASMYAFTCSLIPTFMGRNFPFSNSGHSAGKVLAKSAILSRLFCACRFRLSGERAVVFFASGVSGAARAAGAPVVISRRGGQDVSVRIQGLSDVIF